MDVDDGRTYSTREVCATLKISVRQLLLLVDRGVASPTEGERSGSGYPLRWTAAEVAHVSRPVELARLLRSPISASLIILAYEFNDDDFEALILLLRRNQPAEWAEPEQTHGT